MFVQLENASDSQLSDNLNFLTYPQSHKRLNNRKSTAVLLNNFEITKKQKKIPVKNLIPI